MTFLLPLDVLGSAAIIERALIAEIEILGEPRLPLAMLQVFVADLNQDLPNLDDVFGFAP